MTRRAFLASLLLAAPASAKAPIPEKTGASGQSVKKRRRRRRRTSQRKFRKAVIGLFMLAVLAVGVFLKRRRDRERYAALDD